MPQYLKMFIVYLFICVPILVLLSQSKRFFWYAAPLYLKWSFLWELIPLVFVLFGVSKPTFKQKTQAFIARYETFSATLLRTWVYTVDKIVSAAHLQIRIILLMNRSIASNECVCAGDEYFWHWRQTRFALEMNALARGMNAVKTSVWVSATHTHSWLGLRESTAIYQRLPSRIYVEMIIYSCLPQKQTLSRCGNPKSIYMHNSIFGWTELVFKTK